MSNSTNPKKPSASDFQMADPYTELLHLPPGVRPPHLYQLLEIEMFCPHPEQIEHAARKQFRKIKPFEEHPDRQVRNRIQDVLTHIATARVVLTDPQQKQEYDEKLAKYLSIDRDEILRSRTAIRPPEFHLTVIAGPAQVGTYLDLLPDRIVSIGSDPNCLLCLASSRMYPLHGQLEYVDEDWVLRAGDADRLILVNDQRDAEFVLAEDDVIDVGGLRLRFGRIGNHRPSRGTLPPPLSLIVREGPSISEPILNALPPTSILIGHCDTALWQLPERMVSRHHARIESVGALWEISDLKSTNGTVLNGEEIATSILQHRDQLTIGRFNIQVSLRR